MSSSLLSPALNPLFTLLQSALHPRKSDHMDHMDHMHFGLLCPLISTWICPIRNLNRRLEGAKSEIRVFSPYYPPPGSLLWASCVPQWKSTVPSRKHTLDLSLSVWILVTSPSPCPISLEMVTALLLLALASWIIHCSSLRLYQTFKISPFVNTPFSNYSNWSVPSIPVKTLTDTKEMNIKELCRIEEWKWHY